MGAAFTKTPPGKRPGTHYAILLCARVLQQAACNLAISLGRIGFPPGKLHRTFGSSAYTILQVHFVLASVGCSSHRLSLSECKAVLPPTLPYLCASQPAKQPITRQAPTRQ